MNHISWNALPEEKLEHKEQAGVCSPTDLSIALKVVTSLKGRNVFCACCGGPCQAAWAWGAKRVGKGALPRSQPMSWNVTGDQRSSTLEYFNQGTKVSLLQCQHPQVIVY